MARSHRIPAAFLKHPPPSWGGRGPHRHRRNPIIRNHAIIRNPARAKGAGVLTYVLIGGALYLFLTPGGRAMASSLTRGFMPGTVVPRPTGAVLPTTEQQMIGAGASLLPTITQNIASWLRGLASGSSATTGVTPGALPPGITGGTVEGDVLGTGAGTVTAPDILTGGGWSIGEPLPPIPDTTIPDLTFASWWEQPTDLSGFWGSGPTSEWLGAGGATMIPSVTLTLAPGYESFIDGYDLVDPFAESWSGFMGLGRRNLRYGSKGFSRTLRQPPSYR